MTIGNYIKITTKQFKLMGIPSSRLDVEILLTSILQKDRSWLIGHDEFELDPERQAILDNYTQRRSLHEPIAYILGKQEFYKREFMVNSTVLIPRPESESIIELYKSLKLHTNAMVADVGCGSGALGITAKLEKPIGEVTFIDIDSAVFDIVSKNIKKYDIKNTKQHCGNLLESCDTTFDILLCNLPYVPNHHAVNEAAKFEPKYALYSGDDGLDHFRRLFMQLASGKHGKPIIITESFPEQHRALETVANDSRWQLTQSDGFAQMFIYKN